MKRTQIRLAAAIAILGISGPAFAQGSSMVAGTVAQIYTAQGKITRDHAPIPNPNMDPMTMVFRAQDPAMLKRVKQRDNVQLSADRVNGQITVTKIQKAK